MSAKQALSSAALIAFIGLSPALATAQPLEFAVKRPHLIGSSRGTLVFTDQNVEYRTTDKKDAGTWSYENIKQVQILSPTRIALRTYEDQGWSRMWTDRTFDFEVMKGAITPALTTFLLAKIPRPVVSAVLPASDETARYRVPVKHVRGRRGSQGELLLYANALVYRSSDPGASRYWRFGDLASVLAFDRYQIEVLVNEGGAGKTRPFLFQTKTDPPTGFYDALWAELNAPVARKTASEGQLACCAKPAASKAPTDKGGW